MDKNRLRRIRWMVLFASGSARGHVDTRVFSAPHSGILPATATISCSLNPYAYLNNDIEAKILQSKRLVKNRRKPEWQFANARLLCRIGIRVARRSCSHSAGTAVAQNPVFGDHPGCDGRLEQHVGCNLPPELPSPKRHADAQVAAQRRWVKLDSSPVNTKHNNGDFHDPRTRRHSHSPWSERRF